MTLSKEEIALLKRLIRVQSPAQCSQFLLFCPAQQFAFILSCYKKFLLLDRDFSVIANSDRVHLDLENLDPLSTLAREILEKHSNLLISVARFNLLRLRLEPNP